MLSITGLLFFSFVSLISGRKGAAEFKQAANNLKVQIEQVISEVQSGNYPGLDDFSCVNAGGSLDIDAVPSGDVAKGTNKGCIFLGKAIQFGVVETAGGDQDMYQVYTIAGARTFADPLVGERPVNSFAEAIPKLIAPGQFANTDVPNQSQQMMFENGLTPVGMRIYKASGASDPTGAVAFVTSFEPGASDGLMTGSQAIQLIALAAGAGTGLVRTQTQGVDYINNTLIPSHGNINFLNPAGGVKLCMKSGSNSNRSALITIGGEGKTSSVKVDIKTSGDCS